LPNEPLTEGFQRIQPRGLRARLECLAVGLPVLGQMKLIGFQDVPADRGRCIDRTPMTPSYEVSQSRPANARCLRRQPDTDRPLNKRFLEQVKRTFAGRILGRSPQRRESLGSQHGSPCRIVGMAWRRRNGPHGRQHPSQDAEHYNYFRDYDAAIGRYIESDPIWLVDGLNLYAYVDSRPMGASDALGTQANSRDGSKDRPSRERPDPRPIGAGTGSTSQADREKCYTDCVEIERRVWKEKHFLLCFVGAGIGGLAGSVGGPAGIAGGAGLGFAVGSTPGIGHMIGVSKKCASDCGVVR
jgi:RHS repeat-associated protein